MARITVFTAARMAAIEAASIVGGAINGSGRLILSRNDGSTVDAGAVLGSVPTASTSVAGLVALATGTEATTGTDSNKAVTSNALAAAFVAKLVSASTTVAGLVRLATTAEVQAGTVTNAAVTPSGLSTLVGTNPAGYRFGGQTIITTTGAFTKASYPGLRAVRVKACGGGSAGGGAPVPAAGQHTQGGGGGAGGYGESFILASALATSETVTIGNAGTGVSGANGNNGGNTSFGAFVIALGGQGGTVGASSALQVTAPGGVGGDVTAGDLKCPGAPGGPGSGNASIGFGGQGASTIFGGGGTTSYTGAASGSVVGFNATGYGAGGGGATANAGAVARAGGNGTPGVCVVELYY